jgi:hypothetical protein
MLLGGKQTNIKQVAVVTRNPQFSKLLSTILAEWKYFAVEDYLEAEIVIAERGMKLSTCPGQIVWLTPMPLAEEVFLTVPFSLTQLYHLLEAHFFPTPRRHIRVAMETRVDLKIENDWFEGRMISLSDRGGRIACTNEVPRGKVINLEVKVGEQVFRMSSEVLYCIPAGDSPGRSQPQIGVLFKPGTGEESIMLRNYIEKLSIESACAKEGISHNDPCLSWLDLPKER